MHLQARGHLPSVHVDPACDRALAACVTWESRSPAHSAQPPSQEAWILSPPCPSTPTFVPRKLGLHQPVLPPPAASSSVRPEGCTPDPSTAGVLTAVAGIIGFRDNGALLVLERATRVGVVALKSVRQASASVKGWHRPSRVPHVRTPLKGACLTGTGLFQSPHKQRTCRVYRAQHQGSDNRHLKV